jgi:hypothetical protein
MVGSWCVAAAVALEGRPNNLKTAATTLFQKISKTPMMLAMPEVTVITWSGPPYSAIRLKCMKAPLIVVSCNRWLQSPREDDGIIIRELPAITITTPYI